MATRIKPSEKNSLGEHCPNCQEEKGRNPQIVHVLSFADHDALKEHLNRGTLSPYAKEFLLSFWSMAHQIYFTEAQRKFQPLALVYLEEHGVNVDRRLEWITRYRESRSQQT